MNGIVSYAQNFEDIMLWRALKGVGQGFYVDVGAQHPVIDSVSLAFYEHGWRGIHVEPCQVYADLLHAQRPDEIVIQAAITTRKGLLTFFEIPETGLSTADPEIAERHRQAAYEVKETQVPSLPLSEVFELAQGRDIHWLKVDVEGLEKQVLQSWGRSSVRPWIVVVESTLPNTPIESFQGWEPLLHKRGYRFAYFDGLNRFYVHESHQELLASFQAPPNFFDYFQLAQDTPHCGLLKQKISRLEQAKTQAEKREAELQEVLAERASMLEHAQARSQWLESEWQAAKARIEELAAELAVAQDTQRRQGEELQATQQSLMQAVADKTQAQEQIQWLESEWQAAKAKIEELNTHAHHWFTVATEREKQLAAVYASKSWKVTAPLRLGYELMRWSVNQTVRGVRLTLSALRWLFLFPFRLLGRLFLRTLLFAMRTVLRRPLLAERLNRRIMRFPWLYRPLLALAIRRGLMAGPGVPQPLSSWASDYRGDPSHTTEDDHIHATKWMTDLSQLSPRARQICLDLKAAVERQQREAG